MTSLPGDMTAVAEYGLDRWCRDASWPVGPAETRALSLAAIGAICRAADSADDEWSDCIFSDLRYGDYLVQRIHAITVTARAARAGLEVFTRGDGVGFYYPDYEKLADAFRKQMRPLNRAGVNARDARRRWLGNSHSSFLSRIRGTAVRPATWSVGAGNILKEAYLSRENLPCDFPNPADWQQTAAAAGVPPAVRRLLEEALAEIAAVLPATLPAADLRGLIGLWCERLAQVRSIYNGASLRSTIPETVLWGSPGNVMFRAVIRALKRRGTRVIGFQHGHNPVWVHHPYMAFSEVRGCDEFICGTTGQADAYRLMTHRSGISRTADTRFSSIGIGVYDKWRANPFPRRTVSASLVIH